MKEFLWAWLFWASVVFCSLLVISLGASWLLFSAAPNHQHTWIFATGFGFSFGFIGLGALTVFVFDKFSRKFRPKEEVEGEFFRKIVRESPFFFFTLLFFFSMALYIGILLLMLPYIKTAVGG
ncbi:MAG TPA: hypothetical protein PLP29_05405 [Candidatus Ozemobacteraceae bacterium]|nr:hypothetical protein [Candidatus Ozemobacteraceae bacterium]